MASYSEALSKHATLAAATVDTVTLTVDYRQVAVKNRASSGSGIFFTVDGSTPAVLGDDTFLVLPGEELVVSSLASDAVKLISATADAYTVTGVAQ